MVPGTCFLGCIPNNSVTAVVRRQTHRTAFESQQTQATATGTSSMSLTNPIHKPRPANEGSTIIIPLNRVILFSSVVAEKKNETNVSAPRVKQVRARDDDV